MTNPLAQLTALGQSIWYDNITRSLIHSGELARLIKNESLRGMTSNPTIFEKAVAGSADYDDEIRTLSKAGKSPDEIVEALMIEDVRAAADVFRPVYDASRHGDGTVSIEVAPNLAHDTDATVAAARRIWSTLDRPNVMVKIPATEAGIPAIAQALSEGININITLLFSLDRYRQVIEAFKDGLERRAAAGHRIDALHSVASFFVSRVDGQTDAALAKTGDKGAPLLHKIAIANARVAYELFGASLMTTRWQALAATGAKAQRPLWASTSTKDPSLADTFYVDALIAPDTVNTLPPDTFKAFGDHGRPEVRITPATEKEAAVTLAAYEHLGVTPLDEVTQHLEDDGVTKFSASWKSLTDRVQEKARALT